MSASSVSASWTDLSSDEYKVALADALRSHRDERYKHLTKTQFDQLLAVILDHSESLVIDGVTPTTVEGYAFDIELLPGAQPVRHQLPKLSPNEQLKEKHHVAKAEAAAHLRVPTDEQKSEWATRTHVVHKKDDPHGRWICDFRPLNRVTRKRMTALGDVYTKTRRLAAKLWKSGMDAWSGFNQLRATERASRLMQIITSAGLRQWTVLPFGVTNGPSYFHEFMLHLFSGRSANSVAPDLLGEGMDDLNGTLEVWVDDLQLGTGESEALQGDDGPSGFVQHLQAIKRVLERAAAARLRFKLSKCFFAQFELETLGMIAGCGLVKPDPKKTHAIAVWPRPSRLEDVERFMATTVFIREHLSPRYSEISKPLRDCLKTLQDNRRSGKTRGKAKFLPPSRASVDDAWPYFWSQSCEESFEALKRLVLNAVELVVPDFEGASKGTNPYHLWPDACAYGVGAGLFQSQGEGKAEAEDNFYTRLSIPTWEPKQTLMHGTVSSNVRVRCTVKLAKLRLTRLTKCWLMPSVESSTTKASA